MASIVLSGNSLSAQSQNQPPAPSAAANAGVMTADKALALAEQGRCKEALPALRRIVANPGPLENRRNAGIAGLRCSMTMDSIDSTLDFVKLLEHQFPNDAEILFVLVHTYSDLSTRTAQELGRSAPNSVPAHKLNAEALEMQGKWDEAQREYEDILAKNPNEPSIHYLLGRLLLSKPQGDTAAIQQAKEQFQKELQIDHKNAGAEYILGEMARQAGQCDEAVPYFTNAAKLDPTFGDAFMGWGFCLVTLKKYEDAIAPLQMATRLEEGNPSAHYNLAVAYSRTGKRDEAEKEFAIHRKLTANRPPEEGSAQ
ncbi:MAG: tetratricopeptide repeat protein [Acidobacteria bacterium]|nr:tetratricopeptide repeat protein [Acidobacteriota bacterium]